MEIELLATWLNGAAQDLNKSRDFRKIIQLASVHATEMYGTPDEAESMQAEDPFDVRALIARFASAVDEDARCREAGDKE